MANGFGTGRVYNRSIHFSRLMRSKTFFVSSAAITLLLAVGLGWWWAAGKSSSMSKPETQLAKTGTKASPAVIPVTTLPVVEKQQAQAPAAETNLNPEPIVAFKDWSKRYLAAKPEERAKLEPEGIKLAQARRPVLKQLIKDDAKSALENAVPMVVRQQLPQSILAFLEKRVNRWAGVTVYQGMPPPGEPLPSKSLTHRIASVGDEGAFNMYPTGDLPKKPNAQPNEADPNLLSWTRFPLNGISIDRELAANHEPVRVMEVGEVPNQEKEKVTVCPISGLTTANEDQTSQPVTQEQSVVETPDQTIYLCGGYHRAPLQEVLLYGEGATGGPVVLTGALPAPPTPALGQLKVLYIPMTFLDQKAVLPTESKSYETMRNVADYYSKSSFGKLTTLSTVTPPVTIPRTMAWMIQRDSSNGGEVDGLSQEVNMAREEARRLGYDYTDYDVTVVRMVGGPRATGGWGGGGFVITYGDSVGTTAHEIGHTFNLAHANFWDTAGTSAIGPGSNSEYGNDYDVMGGGNVPTDHYNAAAKVQIKWLPPSYVQNITSSGLYRIYAFDQPALDPRNRYAMTITKDSQRTYWGELRQSYTGNATKPWADNGMILGWKFPGNQSQGGSNIQLIDTTPGSPYGKDDAAIALGQTFGDTEAGIYMTTVNVSSTTPKYVDVLVNMGDFSSNHAPTLSLAASSNIIPLNGTVTFTATASDSDGDTLAYQWQHWGDTNARIVSPNSPSITRIFNTAGSYVVSCTVSDMKGGTVTRTTLVTVGSGNSRFTISGRVTSGGVGVSNVLLTANGTNPTITDSDGNYVIANLAANTYSITPALYGYSFNETFNNSITVGPSFAGANFESDVLPSVSIAAVDASAIEGADTATLRLTRTGDTSVPLTVNVSPLAGTALSSDFALSPALVAGSQGFSTFTIPADASTLDVVLTPTNDGFSEGPETVIYSLGAGAGYLITPNAGTATITLDDPNSTIPKISVLATTDTTDEGTGTPGVLTFKSTLAPTTAPLVVNYTVSGTATSGTDYTALSGTVTIPVGSTTATVNVTPINDTLVEPMETVIVTLSSDAAYLIEPTIKSATVSLFDDDTNVVTITATDSTATEINLSTPGNVADTGTFVIRRAGDLTAPLTVYYAIAGNSSTGVPALNGVDFDALPGVVQIPAGASSASVTITPRWDDLGETPEQVVMQLGAGPTDYKLGSPNVATVTINDGAGNLPYVEVVSAGASTNIMTEGGASGVVRFSLKGSGAGTVAVPFTLSGTATLTTDYTVTLPSTTPASTFDTATGTGTIVLSASATTASTADLTFAPVNDALLEDVESIVCTIPANGVCTTYSPTAKTELWLREDDRPSVWVDAQIGSGGTVTDRVTEGNTATTPQRFYFSRTGALTAALTVNFSLNGSATPGTVAPADYAVTTGGTGAVVFDNVTRLGSVTIPAGASGVSVPITQIQDIVYEGTEFITAHLETGSYGRTQDSTITIVDNDLHATTVSFGSAGSAALESAGTVDIPISLSSPATETTTVDYVVDTGGKVGSVVTNANAAMPYWVRVVKAAAVHTTYVSSDGTNWVQFGQRTLSTNATSFVAGLVAASGTSGVTTTATLDNVSVTGLDAGATISATPTFGSIGATNPASTSSESGGVFTLNAGGTALSTTGTTDVACLVSYAVTNSSNCTITARVTGVSANNTSYAGVTIRHSTANNNAHVSLVAEKTGLTRQVWRTTSATNAGTLTFTPILRPYWVKLQRVGDLFTAWGSSDGTTWTQTGTNKTIPMGLDVQAGLAVCARSDGQLTTATFDNVTFDGVPASGLTGRTVGYVDAQGSNSLAGGVYTVTGSGSLIGNTEDECHFVATTKLGDFTLVARVLSQSGGASNAQAGLMVRATNHRQSLAFYVGTAANALTEMMSRTSPADTALGTGVDFSLPAVQTITFNVGDQNKTIPVTINNDTIPESPENVYLVLRNPIACGLGTNAAHTLVIDDDDFVSPLPTIGFAAPSTTVSENAAGTMNVDVSLSMPSTSAITVDYTVTAGTATAGLDYNGSNGTLSFAPGDTMKSIPVEILDDALIDGTESFTLTLSNPVQAVLNAASTHTVNITDNDLPVVTVLATDANAAEAGLDPGVFTISRTGPTTSDLIVNLTRSGSATSASDYVSFSPTVAFTTTIPAGSASTTITVTPISDTTNEGNEIVGLSVTTSAGVYTVGVNASATVTIADDDRPTLSITATDAVASETPGNTAAFTITRSVVTSTSYSITLSLSGTATNGTDYTSIASTLSFASGETTKTVTVTPVNDLLTEGNETVVLQITSVNANFSGPNYAIATLQDNDFPPSVSITSPSASGALVPSGQGIIVSATATDDGAPAALTTTWSQASGPGTATFASPSALSSTVTFSADGVYVLKFSATDTQFTVSDQVTVIVGSAIAPTEWIAQDMSPSTQQRGQSAKVGGSYVLTGMGAGHGIVVATSTYGDAAHVMSRSVTGDGSIVARLTTLSGPATAPLAGVTIRDSLNRSVNRAVLGYNNGTLSFTTRTTVIAADNAAATQTGITLPIWVKLDRVSSSAATNANVITASYSSDGTTWTTLGTPTAITMLDDTTQMGLVATGNSGTAANICTATFDNVTLTPAPSGNALIAEPFGTAPTTMPTFAFDGTTYTIAAADAMDSNGAFYGWQYQGDVMITAKLASASSGALNAKSGLMIRESMDDTSAFSHVGRITTGSFAGYIWRNVAGGTRSGVPSFIQTTRWMRLIRQGNRITAFHAPDASGSPGTWTQLGSARTIILPTNVLIGFAVDNQGGANGVLNTCTFTNLSIVPLNKAPAISIAIGNDLSPVSLNGTVTDDDYPLPVSLTTQWSQLSGPSTLTFANATQAATTATFTGAGLFGVRLQANDSSILSFKDSTFTAYESPFAKWLTTTTTGNGNNTLAEATLDADGDGLMNLLEYAIGTNGTVTTTNPQVITLAPVSTDKYLRLSIPKNPAATDVTFIVEACSDLVSWSSAGLVIETNTSNQLVVRDNVPVSANNKRFMRVRVMRL